MLMSVKPIIGIACVVILGLWVYMTHSGIILWHPPTKGPDVYRVANLHTSQSLTYAFMPSGRLVVARTEGEHVCQWLGTVRGEYGHRLIWRLWYTPRPGWELLNYKVVEQGYTPVAFEDEVEARSGDACEGLAAPGETIKFVAEFSKDVMKTWGMELRRGTTEDGSEVKMIERILHDKTRK